MSSKIIYHLNHPEARRRASETAFTAPDGWVVTYSEPTRSLDQNAAQWPILQAFSEQVQWPVNGQMVQMSPEEWKDVLSSAFRSEMLRLAMAWDGRGVVSLGQRTSKFGKKRFSDWLEFLHACAAEKGVDLNGC